MSSLFDSTDSEDDDFVYDLEAENSVDEVVEEEPEVNEEVEPEPEYEDNCVRCIDGVYSRGGVNYVEGETYYVDDVDFFLSLRRSGSGAKMFERC